MGRRPISGLRFGPLVVATRRIPTGPPRSVVRHAVVAHAHHVPMGQPVPRRIGTACRVITDDGTLA